MERFYTENGRYDQDADGNAVDIPLDVSPIDGDAEYYDISLVGDELDDTAFTLQAEPKGAQAGDTCGTMTIDHLGQKTPAGSDCWRK
jgi:type IV pilus assembly protein PilE